MVQTLRPNQIADNINADCRHMNKQIQVEVSVAVTLLLASRGKLLLQLPRRHGLQMRPCNCHGMANVYEIISQYRPNQIAGREPRREINSHTNPSINNKHAGPMTYMKCWAFLACGIILNLWNLLHAKWASLCAPACNSILTQINRRASGPMVC